VGLRALAAALAAAGVAAAATPIEDAARFVESRRAPGGGFAEPGGEPTPGLTAWAVLGLRAAGRSAESLADARAYLERAEAGTRAATELELALVARAALGERPAALVTRVRALQRRDGGIGPTLNSTIWGIIALRAAGEPAPRGAVRLLLRRQHRSGGWGWSAGVGPDSNDTAAAVQALRAVAVGGRPITRALAFLNRHQRPDGGFELVRGRGSDAQSTAWAVQAFAAAGAPPRRRCG
jgi:hypothetical protein